MYSIKDIVCTTVCICTYFNVAANSPDSISDKFSCRILESLDYCWNNRAYTDTDATRDAAYHKYIISPVLNAFYSNADDRFEPDIIGYRCKRYRIEAKESEENMRHYLIEINILSDIKGDDSITTKLEELKKHDYMIVDIISEAPVICLVFMEADRFIAVTYNMFYDFDDVLSVSKLFVRQHISAINRTATYTRLNICRPRSC